MTGGKKRERSYQAMLEELDSLLTWFQRDDIDLTIAIAKYEYGMELIQMLEKHLKAAENRVQMIKQRFDVIVADDISSNTLAL